jgi:hypothetical protein
LSQTILTPSKTQTSIKCRSPKSSKYGGGDPEISGRQSCSLDHIGNDYRNPLIIFLRSFNNNEIQIFELF